MNHSVILTFIGFFFAGLAVNLTPCVYPMLTVTASLFKPNAAAKETLRHSFIKALFYFLGISVMYSALGYFAAATGKVFGGALQNSWVLGGIAVMMFALAFSMFGLYQLRAPVELLNKIAGWRKANYVGLFISGMLVGVFAAPCIGPPVIALLAAVADNGSPAFGLSAFFIFSCGLGLPYLLLGTFSGLMTKLPKAGKWLIWVERVFGMILLWLGFFYLMLALHLNVIHPGASKIAWKPYAAQVVQESVAHNKSVMLDFYADWCEACHDLDREVYSDPTVIKELSQFSTYKVDSTNTDDPKVQSLFDQYGIIGLPTVIFLDHQGHEIKNARIEGAVSVKKFLKSLSMSH